MRIAHASMYAGVLVAGLALVGCSTSVGSGSALGLQGDESPSAQAQLTASQAAEEDDSSAAAALDETGSLAVMSMAPAAGPAVGDTLVTITGKGFDTVVSVTFGGEEAVEVEVVSPTEITAFTPPGDAGVVDVVITDDTGTAVSPGGGFTYLVKAQGPKVVAVVPADGQAKVAFTPPRDGGGEIVNYEYTVDDGVTWAAFDPPQTQTPVTISGLTNGTEYLVALRALTAAGLGARGDSKSVTPRAAAASIAKPDRATISNWASGDGWISVTFTGAPLSGAAAVTGYECSLDLGKTWDSCVSPAKVEGLDNGTKYTIWVRALNVAGAGQPKSMSLTPKAPAAAAVPAAKPVKPSAPTVTARVLNRSADPAVGGTAALSFTGPNHTGVNTITGYKCAISTSTTKGTYAACSSPWRVTRLTKGAKYTIFVIAVNRGGNSAPVSWAFTAK